MGCTAVRRGLRLLVVALPATWAVIIPTGQARADDPAGPGDVVINEVLADPVTQPAEAIELYNTTGAALDISGYWIDDIAAGGGAPKAIPASTVIPAGGHYVMQTTAFLNNGGDDVRLLSPDQTVVLDTYTYKSSADDMSWCRQPDGGTWLPTQCEPTLGATNGGTVGGTWVPGTFQVYFFDVEQAHSHFVITPSGHSVLIEAGETNWNSGANAARIATALQQILGHRNLDYIAVGHQHLDHIGYVGYGGIWALLEEHGVTAGALLDRDSGTWVDTNSDGICDPDLEIQWHNAGTTSGTSRKWLCYVTDPTTIGGSIRQIVPVDTVIDFGDGVTMTLVMQDAVGVMQADGITPVAGDHTADPIPTSENDYSQNWLVQYGSIDFLSGSDTDGEYAVSSFGYSYNDVEAHVAAAIGHEIEILHVNHHGSSHSSNQAFLDVLQPDVSVISCGTNGYEHPTQAVLDRLHGVGSDIYITNLCDPDRDYSHSVITNGTFSLSSTDGVNYTVDGHQSYVATDPTPPVVAGPADVVINEFLPSPSGGAAEWIELYNPTSTAIDISGTYLDDIASGGGAPKAIPASTVIPAGGYYVLETSNFLNNTGDDVRFLAADGVTVYDTYTYGNTASDRSWYRSTDGGAWAATATTAPTKGTANPA